MACYTDWLIAERNKIANMEFRGGPNGNSGVRSHRKKANSSRHKEMGSAGEICWQSIPTRWTISSNWLLCWLCRQR